MTKRLPRPNVISEESVLDLPLDKQKECAKIMGYDDFDAWVAYIKKSSDETWEICRQLDEANANYKEGELPEGWTQDTLDNWISKMET